MAGILYLSLHRESGWADILYLSVLRTPDLIAILYFSMYSEPDWTTILLYLVGVQNNGLDGLTNISVSDICL